MQHRLFILLAIQCLFVFGDQLRAQDLGYKVIWKNDSVGYLDAMRYDSAGYDICKIDSEVNLWLLGAKHIQYYYYSRYKNNKLVYATSFYKKNDQIKAQSAIILEGSSYHITVDGKASQMDSRQVVDQSVTTIYHKEPVDKDEIFSERFGHFLGISSDSPHQYELKKPDGRPTTYYYEDGICSKVIIDHFLTSFEFLRVR